MLDTPAQTVWHPAFLNLQTWDVIIILAVLLLLFGGRKLPELARGLGRGLRLFKEEVSGVAKQLDDDEPAKTDAPGPVKTDQKPPPPANNA
jgi:sec-independent protein translocase protein TatA